MYSCNRCSYIEWVMRSYGRNAQWYPFEIYIWEYEAIVLCGGNWNIMMINKEDGEVLSHSYDYIIIGAGPSACGLLHGLLSREQHNKHQTRRITICIIEAGSQQQTSSTYAKDWPKTAFYTNKQHNNYISVPQSALNNRILDIPIGSGLGKSALVLF